MLNNVALTEVVSASALLLSAVAALGSFWVGFQVKKDNLKTHQYIDELTRNREEALSYFNEALARKKHIFQAKEETLLNLYNKVAKIAYSAELFVVPYTTKDTQEHRASMLNKMSEEFRELRLYVLQRELFLSEGLEVGRVLGKLMEMINGIQNLPNEWERNVLIVQEKLMPLLKTFKQQIQEELGL